MKNLYVLLITLITLQITVRSQTINHNSIDLQSIPSNWIDSAKVNLYIGYGHTSHGSQITSGMNAIEEYFTDGTYNWSNSGGENELHLFEGDGYGDGYLDHDIGYEGWDDETREYLDAFPECNVIIWSWCEQVNNVDLQTHLFDNMEALESEYPNVTFVYMTGHLEGKGLAGDVFAANQQIRDYCNRNNKFLFDFADIEKYSPDADTNYQQYNANDECYYDVDGRTQNWATNWLNANPTHELAQISGYCGSCAHSVSLNCVKKGIAAWYLWAQLAGWGDDNQTTSVMTVSANDLDISAYSQGGTNEIHVSISSEFPQLVDFNIYSITGSSIYNKSNNQLYEGSNEFTLSPTGLSKGIYFLEAKTSNKRQVSKIILR